MSFNSPFPYPHSPSYGHGLGFLSFAQTLQRLASPLFNPSIVGLSDQFGIREAATAWTLMDNFIRQAMEAKKRNAILTIELNNVDSAQNRLFDGPPCPRTDCQMPHIRLIFNGQTGGPRTTELYDLPTEIVVPTWMTHPRLQSYTTIPGYNPPWFHTVVSDYGNGTLGDVFRFQIPPAWTRAVNDVDVEGEWLRLIRRQEQAYARSLGDEYLRTTWIDAARINNLLEQSQRRRVPINRLDVVGWEWLAREEALMTERTRRAHHHVELGRQMFRPHRHVSATQRPRPTAVRNTQGPSVVNTSSIATEAPRDNRPSMRPPAPASDPRSPRVTRSGPFATRPIVAPRPTPIAIPIFRPPTPRPDPHLTAAETLAGLRGHSSPNLRQTTVTRAASRPSSAPA